jgi:hypothetical protein
MLACCHQFRYNKRSHCSTGATLSLWCGQPSAGASESTAYGGKPGNEKKADVDVTNGVVSTVMLSGELNIVG